MSTLLVLRERLQKIYAGYSVYITKLFQFVMGILLFWLINSNIGFMKEASSMMCTAGLAAVCTLLPVTVMVLAASALVLLHFYMLSMPIAAVSLVIFVLMYIFYFRFTPGKAWLVLLSIIAVGFKVPFVVPVVFGLLGTPSWIVPAALGVVSVYMGSIVKASTTALKSAEGIQMIDAMASFTKQLFLNREMWLVAAAVVLGTLVVYTVRTRSFDHAWKIASASGAAVCVIVSMAGDIFLELNIEYTIIIVSAVLGALVGLVLEFLFFSVDYSRTEHIQFEDDEYYYYVKAVPKIGVSAPELEVKHITGHQNVPEEQREQITQSEGKDERNTEEILLTRSLSRELGLDQEETDGN